MALLEAHFHVLVIFYILTSMAARTSQQNGGKHPDYALLTGNLDASQSI